MTDRKDTSSSGDLVGDDFAPIWDESILLAEHEAVQASVDVGGWLSAALDDPNVCDAMKTDINRWFSAGFLYLNEVRKLMQTEREALCRAIEQHEAFRQEVSDAVVAAKAYYEVPMYDLSAFIIAKPDLLVEAWQIAFPGNHIEDARDECAKISAAIKKRGGKIVWGEG